MELKYDAQKQINKQSMGSNRTFMELKFNFLRYALSRILF